MTPLAHILVAAAVLLAACVNAAPAFSSDLQPELEDFLGKDATTEAIAVGQNLGNDLRAKPLDIPVEIIEDSRPAIKTNEVADDDEEIKRPSIDLRNPGPPQRQEHETQNADNFLNVQENLLTVRETIVQTQDLLRKGFQGVSDDISNWLTTNEKVNTIQQNIQSLRDTFTLQIEKLNEAVQGLAAPQPLKTEKIPESVQTQSGLQTVETSIHILENNFNNGVRALSEGVSIVEILRAEDASTAVTETASTSSTTGSPDAPFVLSQFMTNLQNSFSQSIRNITEAVSNIPAVSNLQNFLSPTTSPLAPGGAALADTPVGTAPNPASNPWPNWQLPNIPNIFSGQPAQPGSQSQTPGPIQGTIQNVIQNSNNFLQSFFGRPIAQPPASGSNAPKPNDEKQPESPSIAVAAAPIVPAAAASIVAAPPADAVPAVSPPAAAAPAGPIQQILSTNPVVQSIASTVQRIQSSINNPEKPRDTEKKEDISTKGGYYGGGGGHRPNGE